MTIYSVLESPLGDLLLTGDGGSISGLFTVPHAVEPATARRDDAAFAGAAEQLGAYFAGELDAFDLPLAPAGTPFQRRVWDALLTIPYGETATYAELAAAIGRPGAARAVGHANGRNPISIVIPCHRVVGSDGTLTGYAGGLDRKRALLDLEGATTRR